MQVCKLHGFLQYEAHNLQWVQEKVDNDKLRQFILLHNNIHHLALTETLALEDHCFWFFQYALSQFVILKLSLSLQ